jgi:pilus assembly protein CpaB
MNKMSPGTLILGIFAILFGLVGAYAAKKYLQQQTPQVTAEEAALQQTYTVPVAINDLAAGRTITLGDLMVERLNYEDIRRRGLPASFMSKSSEIIGRTLKEPVKRGHAFEPTVFYPQGIAPNVVDRLVAGQRAVTIAFTGSAAAAGLITPGADVDVLFRTFGDRTGLPETTVTLLDNVRVLAVGKEMFEGAVGGNAGKGRFRTVTLSVNTTQAQALKIVEDRGTMMLVLRNGDDPASADVPGPKTLPELLGIRRTDQPFRTEYYRRGRLTTIYHGNGSPRYEHQAPFGMPVVGPVDNPSQPEAPANAAAAVPAPPANALSTQAETGHTANGQSQAANQQQGYNETVF